MLKILPLILLTHNLDQGPGSCIGPCFGTKCPSGMHCFNGECCDEPYSTTLVTKEPNYPTTIDVKNKPLEQTTDPLKLSRLITPIPSIPSTEYPKLPNTVVPQITNRQIDNNRARPTCVDVSPSCQSINHLCFNVVYQIVMCAFTCNRCNSPAINTLQSRQAKPSCLDYGRNCKSLKHLCKNNAYSTMLNRVCQYTCLCS